MAVTQWEPQGWAMGALTGSIPSNDLHCWNLGDFHWLSQGDEVKLGHPFFLPLEKPLLTPEPKGTTGKVLATPES